VVSKLTFIGLSKRASNLLEHVYTNVCGLVSMIARSGFQYFITFIDDFSRYDYVYLMKHKSETFGRFMLDI
jgi:hypothetical protein